MDDGETLPVACEQCGQTTPKPVRWMQENTFYTCAACGHKARIDKDQAMKLLATLRYGVG